MKYVCNKTTGRRRSTRERCSCTSLRLVCMPQHLLLHPLLCVSCHQMPPHQLLLSPGLAACSASDAPLTPAGVYGVMPTLSRSATRKVMVLTFVAGFCPPAPIDIVVVDRKVSRWIAVSHLLPRALGERHCGPLQPPAVPARGWPTLSVLLWEAKSCRQSQCAAALARLH